MQSEVRKVILIGRESIIIHILIVCILLLYGLKCTYFMFCSNQIQILPIFFVKISQVTTLQLGDVEYRF